MVGEKLISKLQKVWTSICFIILLSVTNIGKQLVHNLVSLIYLVFNFAITSEIIICSYRVMLILFLLLTCILIAFSGWKKFHPKNEYHVEPEFEQIVKNNNLMNIWVLGPWGSGKTKFVKDSLNNIGQKFFYVSLFGLHTRNEIIQEINEQIVAETRLSVLVDLPVIGILFKWLVQIKGLSILKNYKDTHIVVIDDFERVSNDFFIHNKNFDDDTIELVSYNDVLGVIDYIQQLIGCKVLVISSDDNLDKLLTEIIIPKFHPYQYHVKFDIAKIIDFPKLFFKKNNSQDVENFSAIFSSVWIERADKASLTNYRPIIHELSFLSDETDTRYQISYVLSRLMDFWEIKMPEGSMIPFQFLLDRVKNRRHETIRYNLIKKIIGENSFKNGFPYYVLENGKKRVTDKFEAQEVLVRNYMGLVLSDSEISEDYKFDDNEILLLTSKNPELQLQKKKIKVWVSENYIKFKYRQPTMTYENILVSGQFWSSWKKIYQNELAKYYVKDEQIDFDPQLTNSIINTITRFDFLTSNIERFLDVIDIDYVIELLPDCNPDGNYEESLIASRILYRYLSSYYPISGSISLYLIAEYLADNFNVRFEISNDDCMFPVISNDCNSAIDFVKSKQYKFDELLLNLSENTIDNEKFKDEKILESEEFTIHKEHAFYIVKFMETTDTINGVTAQEHIRKFLEKESYDLITVVNNLERFCTIDDKNHRVNDYRMEYEYDDDGEIVYEYPIYYEPLKERYNRWWKYIDELEKSKL